MLEYTNCNLCGSNETRILISRNLSNIAQCKNCGLVYKNPRPSEKESLIHFAFTRDIIQYKNLMGYDPKIKIFAKNLKRIEKYAPKGRLLDIGCGYGTFLKMAEGNGWQARGVEISEWACRYNKEKLELNIFKGTLKETHFPNNFFDVITLWDVLDMLNNPFAGLLEVSRILKRGGLLLFRVRNMTFHLNVHFIFGNLAKKLNIKPTRLHLYAFSARTAKKMLQKADFKDIKVINSELTTGDPYFTGGIFGLFGVIVIKKIIFSLSQLIFYLTGGLLVLSPSILVFAKKRLNDS